MKAPIAQSGALPGKAKIGPFVALHGQNVLKITRIWKFSLHVMV
jgi:hypothetical protein